MKNAAGFPAKLPSGEVDIGPIRTCSDVYVVRQADFLTEHKLGILQALRRANFIFQSIQSFNNLIQAEGDAESGAGGVLMMYWGSAETSESHVTLTVSMSTSSCSSIVTPAPASPITSAPVQASLDPETEPDSLRVQARHSQPHELRSTAQQTDISCRGTAALDDHTLESLERGVVVSAHTHSPTSSQSPAERSISILGSVCALLLSKQNSQLAQPAAPKEVPSYAGSTAPDNICRICFGGESAERLVRPCGCRGTIAAVHRTCLERWLLAASTSYCELCRHHYTVTRTHKWTWLKSVAAWAVSGHGRALAADVSRGLVLGAASVLGTARALHACDTALHAGAARGGPAALAANVFSSLLIGIIGALNGLLTTWILLKVQEHQQSWRAWRDSTLHVHVTLHDDVTPTGSDVTVVAPDQVHSEQDPVLLVDRSTNIADPFMVSLPYHLPEWP